MGTTRLNGQHEDIIYCSALLLWSFFFQLELEGTDACMHFLAAANDRLGDFYDSCNAHVYRPRYW
jgi:hypothetical protein